MDLPETSRRVEANTPDDINRLNQRQIEANLTYYAARLDEIEDRLHELDREWDVERSLEANASTLTLVLLGLGLFYRRAAFLPVVVAGFLLQHALQGWCPPVSVFRRFGIRTMREIDEERFALKALRGDFREASAEERSVEDAARAALAAVQR